MDDTLAAEAHDYLLKHRLTRLGAVAVCVEAAALDGAGAWNRFRHVSLPAIRKTLMFVTVLLAAGIAGVVPALKITRGMGGRLQQASAGAGGMRFGGICCIARCSACSGFNQV